MRGDGSQQGLGWQGTLLARPRAAGTEWLYNCSLGGVLHHNVKYNVSAGGVSTGIQQERVFSRCRLTQCFYLQWILSISTADDPAPIYLQMNLTNPVQLHWTSNFFFFPVSSVWQVDYYLQCSTSLTSVRVCRAPFCDPRGWLKSSAIEAVKFLKLKFLNPMAARNQPHHIFLRVAWCSYLMILFKLYLRTSWWYICLQPTLYSKLLLLLVLS